MGHLTCREYNGSNTPQQEIDLKEVLLKVPNHTVYGAIVHRDPASQLASNEYTYYGSEKLPIYRFYPNTYRSMGHVLLGSNEMIVEDDITGKAVKPETILHVAVVVVSVIQ